MARCTCIGKLTKILVNNILTNTLALINTQMKNLHKRWIKYASYLTVSNLLCDSAQTRSVVKFGMNPYLVK